MVAENPTWGAPRIHGELLKLGFDVPERSVSRWIRRAPKNPDPVKRWLTFLRNHREAIAAMDFFTVPTLTFGVLYCFFVIGHDRRKILHFNVTHNPNALWVVQQLREAWAYKEPHRFLLFDRDAKFGAEAVSAVRDMGSQPTRAVFRSPWQIGVAERWVGSCRRDLLDHVIILSLHFQTEELPPNRKRFFLCGALRFGELQGRYILMTTRSNRTAVTVWDSNKRRGSVLTS
jgi:hypothetical protein